MTTLLIVGSFAFNASVEPALSVFAMEANATPVLLDRLSAINPSFVWQPPAQARFYAVNETRGDDAMVTRFVWDGISRKLSPAESLPSGGGSPCHLNGTSHWLIVANYGGGTVRFLGLDGRESFTFHHDGSGPDAKRQTAPHPHGVHLSPGGDWVAVPDLGIDQVICYALPRDAAPARLAALNCPPGSGPRHAAFHPHLPRLYVLTELDNQILVWEVESGPSGARELARLSSLPEGFHGRSHGAEILVHPDGRWLLASNRGADTIGIWRLDRDGLPTPVGHFPAGGKTPRSMALNADGTLLAVGLQDGGRVRLFAFDDGALREAGDVTVPSPAFVGFFEAPSP